ncbi:predicted protein [Sclerotinia sclerotiorum 1980 UF-70]|uniref:Uncharacterized protein n=1 Tax=Sclerotinia sclerotiorum (strain ATCC 18683 / 1980 / Ss-1) TaxID=665079 RepID=A7EZU5_SCLS1|nr:predicted protein [Sclerotinia sclerotiorum 1980 UF-70]EDN94987.1 predicted protein [Sclerotinia sclerotiorum 1980 UF-70]
MDSEAEKKEAEYARYLARASEDETSVSPDEESDDMDSGAEGKEADYARDQAEASEASEDKISVLSDEEREEEYLGDNSPTRRVDDPAFGQGFSWTCCRKTGNAVGCEVSSHRPKLEDSSNKRTKV